MRFQQLVSEVEKPVGELMLMSPGQRGTQVARRGEEIASGSGMKG